MQGQAADLAKALAPVFAAALAIQQAIELLDGLWSAYASGQTAKESGPWKKPILKLVAVALGALTVVITTWNGEALSVLTPLGYEKAGWIDSGLTSLLIGGGTEAMNSIMKFLGYAKENKKTDAGLKAAGATVDQKQAIAKMGHR